MKRIRCLVLLASVFAVSLSVSIAAQLPPISKAQHLVLWKLGSAKTYAELKKVYRALPKDNRLFSWAYALKRNELDPGPQSDRLLIEAIPASEEELSRLYSLSYSQEDPNNPFGWYDSGAYFEPFAKAVLRQKKGFLPFLRLSSYAGGELSEQLDEWTCYLKKGNPSAFAAAFSQLVPAERTTIPEDCEHL